MYSLLKEYKINGKTIEHTIIVTAIRINNDYYGNPRHKITVWAKHDNGQGSIWSPTVKGYRRNKDDSYTLNSTYNLPVDIGLFVDKFEESINKEI
jgi:hypothetical protein